MLLNTRDPAKICASIDRWPSLRERIVRANIPGLPARMGIDDAEIIRWIENHYAACRRFFAGDAKFLELDIGDEAAPKILGKALGVAIKDWGIIAPNKCNLNGRKRMIGSSGTSRINGLFFI